MGKLKEREHLEKVIADGRIITNWVLEKWGVSLDGINFPRTETGGELFWTR